MSKSFKNSPLVELVTELRWQPSVEEHKPNIQEEFFMRFGGAVYGLGFQRIERLFPSGFPLMQNQVISRFRKGESSGEVYQIGAGVFTANALPPYSSWDDFLPVVQQGIDALLSTRPDAEKQTPFRSIGLRYINAFSSELMNGLSTEKFIREVFGINFHIPDCLTRKLQEGKEFTPSVQLNIPLSDEMKMFINISEGLIHDKNQLALEINIQINEDVNPNKDLIITKLCLAHDAIHDVFYGMTEKIHPLMSSI